MTADAGPDLDLERLEHSLRLHRRILRRRLLALVGLATAYVAWAMVAGGWAWVPAPLVALALMIAALQYRARPGRDYQEALKTIAARVLEPAFVPCEAANWRFGAIIEQREGRDTPSPQPSPARGEGVSFRATSTLSPRGRGWRRSRRVRGCVRRLAVSPWKWANTTARQDGGPSTPAQEDFNLLLRLDGAPVAISVRRQADGTAHLTVRRGDAPSPLLTRVLPEPPLRLSWDSSAAELRAGLHTLRAALDEAFEPVSRRRSPR